MDNVLNSERMEQLLVAKWAEVLDARKVIAFTLACVRDHLSDLNEDRVDELPKSRVQVSVSRFQPANDHFLIWVEFSVPLDGRVAVGTHELRLALGGKLDHVRTVGNLFVEA